MYVMLYVFSDCTVEESFVTEEKEPHNDAFISDAVPESCDFKQEGGGSTVPILTDQHGMLTTKQVLTIFESVNTENIITVPRLHQKLVKCICLKLFLILLKMIGNVMGIDGSNVGTKSFPRRIRCGSNTISMFMTGKVKMDSTHLQKGVSITC